MGNTVGAYQTPDTLPGFLAELGAVVGPGGRLLCSMVDPLETDQPVHLEYHQRNRERGLPPGLTKIRMKYRGQADDWMFLWMPTEEELHEATKAASWDLIEERAEGPHRVRLFEHRG